MHELFSSVLISKLPCYGFEKPGKKAFFKRIQDGDVDMTGEASVVSGFPRAVLHFRVLQTTTGY